MFYNISNLPCENILYTTEADTSIETVKDALDKLLYSPLTISFSTPTTIFEKGTVIESIWFNWSYNKKIVRPLSNYCKIKVIIIKYYSNM